MYYYVLKSKLGTSPELTDDMADELLCRMIDGIHIMRHNLRQVRNVMCDYGTTQDEVYETALEKMNELMDMLCASRDGEYPARYGKEEN